MKKGFLTLLILSMSACDGAGVAHGDSITVSSGCEMHEFTFVENVCVSVESFETHTVCKTELNCEQVSYPQEQVYCGSDVEIVDGTVCGMEEYSYSATNCWTVPEGNSTEGESPHYDWLDGGEGDHEDDHQDDHEGSQSGTEESICEEVICETEEVVDSLYVCLEWDASIEAQSCEVSTFESTMEVCIEDEDCMDEVIIIQEDVCEEQTFVREIEVCVEPPLENEVPDLEWLQGGEPPLGQ